MLAYADFCNTGEGLLPHNSVNRFLSALSPAARENVLAKCSFGELPVGTVLYRPEEEVRHCYFLVSGIASVVIAMEEGEIAEVVLTGKEGVVGCLHMLGPTKVPTSCFIQLSAAGFRIRYTELEKIFHTCEETRSRILELVQQEACTLSRIAGCNRLHPAAGRLARWLLMAQDRTESPHLDFTQVFLAEMLGVERTTVSAVASSLQDDGLIEYARGHLTITDRAGLEACACSCYGTAQKLLSGLYQTTWKRKDIRPNRDSY